MAQLVGLLLAIVNIYSSLLYFQFSFMGILFTYIVKMEIKIRGKE